MARERKKGCAPHKASVLGPQGGIEKGVGVREKSWGRRLTAPSCCPPLTTAGQCNIRAWSGRREAPPPVCTHPAGLPLPLARSQSIYLPFHASCFRQWGREGGSLQPGFSSLCCHCASLWPLLALSESLESISQLPLCNLFTLLCVFFRGLSF